jgi:NAD(P)-dependent dehydrogenase (short-subunit alcohol dehydrogenase family)
MSLQNKIAIVTGGGTGLGFATAKELAARGARVIITGRRSSTLDEAVGLLGENVTASQVDVTQVAELEAFFAKIKQEYGRIDILVANAGGGEVVPLAMVTEEHFDRTFNTNVKGLLFTVQKALPLMGKGSSVVLIGSTTSIEPPPGMSVYGASKAAVRNLVRSWIVEIKGSGVRINVLSPGPVDTPSLRATIPGKGDEMVASLSEKSPIGRIGEPVEIARAVAFLASDDSSYINGVELFADGGASQI